MPQPGISSGVATIFSNPDQKFWLHIQDRSAPEHFFMEGIVSGTNADKL